jgi:hypothetical protein
MNTIGFHLQEPSPIGTAHNQIRSESQALKPKTETEAPSKMKIGSGNHELTHKKIGTCTHELLSRKRGEHQPQKFQPLCEDLRLSKDLLGCGTGGGNGNEVVSAVPSTNGLKTGRKEKSPKK